MLRRAVALAGVCAQALACVAMAAPAAAQPGQCGENLVALEIAQAVATLRPAFDDMDVAWDASPYDGNCNPCAALSTALVSVRGATGSSPDQALFFHYGRYLGTATWEPYGFTTLNRAAARDDMVVLNYVVLNYKDNRFVSTACPGPINSVRYLWRGDHVEMLDSPPPR